MTQPVTEEVTQPVTEEVTQPVTEEVTQQVTEVVQPVTEGEGVTEEEEGIPEEFNYDYDEHVSKPSIEGMPDDVLSLQYPLISPLFIVYLLLYDFFN